MFPGIQIEVTSGNLQRQISAPDGIGAIIATAFVVGNIAAPKVVYNLPDAIEKGYTESDEPFIYDLLKTYYTELGGNKKLYIMGIAETTTMADALTSTNVNGAAKLLQFAQGEISLLAIARKPVAGYDGGEAFFDSDVQASVLACKALAQAWQGKNTPLRIFIEGRVENENVVNTFKPNTASNGYCGVVLGGTVANGSAAVTLVLARACKYGAHVKIGNGQNGALYVSQMYVGTKKYEERVDMETFHDDGFITVQKRPGLAGYYFGRDNMASADDFKILVHGRVIDKAQRVTAQAYAQYIETDVDLDDDGSIKDSDAYHLEKILEQAILSNLAGQISNAKVVIDPEQTGVLQSSNLAADLAVLPLGYLTWITVRLGLTSQIS